MQTKAVDTVYWDQMHIPLFGDDPIYLAATDRGLCRITWPNESFETIRSWVDKRMPDASLIRDPGRLSEYVRQLEAYLDGRLRTFDVPVDLRGTPFQLAVWQALAEIPYGAVRSYSDIAERVGRPSAVRAVGMANGSNPVPIVIPCHRVIGKNTALTGFRGGLRTKEALLRLEGFQDYKALSAHA